MCPAHRGNFNFIPLDQRIYSQLVGHVQIEVTQSQPAMPEPDSGDAHQASWQLLELALVADGPKIAIFQSFLFESVSCHQAPPPAPSKTVFSAMLT